MILNHMGSTISAILLHATTTNCWLTQKQQVSISNIFFLHPLLLCPNHSGGWAFQDHLLHSAMWHIPTQNHCLKPMSSLSVTCGKLPFVANHPARGDSSRLRSRQMAILRIRSKGECKTKIMGELPMQLSCQATCVHDIG